MSLPGWVDSTIWWQVYPLGFAGADQEARLNTSLQHRLPESAWLDYLRRIRRIGLALGPCSRPHPWLRHHRPLPHRSAAR